jgi:hypothetical protein
MEGVLGTTQQYKLIISAGAKCGSCQSHNKSVNHMVVWADNLWTGATKAKGETLPRGFFPQ